MDDHLIDTKAVENTPVRSPTRQSFFEQGEIFIPGTSIAISLRAISLVAILWPFIKVSDLNQHNSKFLLSICSIFLLFLNMTPLNPLSFIVFFLLNYLGIIWSDIQGIMTLVNVNTMSKLIYEVRNKAGWDIIYSIEHRERGNNVSLNVLSLILFFILWAICFTIGMILDDDFY